MKYYAIPIDKDGYAYFSIKAGYSPYTNNSWFCGGCPQVYGGNNQGSMIDTLYNEALEESHGKILLSKKQDDYKAIHKNNSMHFYTCSTFEYDDELILSERKKKLNEYKETTGEVLILEMSKIPRSTTRAVASFMLTSYFQKSGGRRPKPINQEQFLKSETVKAILAASKSFNKL